MSKIITARNFLCYSLSFFMIACISLKKTKPLSNTDRSNCLALLRQTMYNQQRWIKVHAAEYLLWLGNSKEVEKVFLKEEKRNGNVSEYRVGIWRVLYQVSPASQKQ